MTFLNPPSWISQFPHDHRKRHKSIENYSKTIMECLNVLQCCLENWENDQYNEELYLKIRNLG